MWVVDPEIRNSSRWRDVVTWFVLGVCGVFEQRLVEVIVCPFATAQVVGRDSKDILTDLQFERVAGGGDVCAGQGEISLGVDLVLAGGGKRVFQGGELGEQFGAEVVFVLCGGGNQAIEQSGDLAKTGLVVFLEALREKFGIRTAIFRKFVADAAFALAHGGAEELERVVFGDRAAGLGGLESGSGGEGGIKSVKGGFCRRQKGSEMCGKCGDGFEFANVVFRELAQFFATDFAVGQLIFKESLDVEHTVLLLSNDSLSSKRDVGGHAKILMPRNHSAEGVRNFRSGIFRVAGGVRNFWSGLRSLADTDAFMSGA